MTDNVVPFAGREFPHHEKMSAEHSIEFLKLLCSIPTQAARDEALDLLREFVSALGDRQ